MKEHFVFKREWVSVLQELQDDERLQLYDAIIDYAFFSKEQELGKECKIAFYFIKLSIDKEKHISKVRSLNGAKGGSAKKDELEISKSKQTEANVSKSKQTEANVSKSKQTEANGSKSNEIVFKVTDRQKDTKIGNTQKLQYPQNFLGLDREKLLEAYLSYSLIYNNILYKYNNNIIYNNIYNYNILTCARERKEAFNQSLSQYIPKYGEDVIKKFYDYWTCEIAPGVMKFEKENSFYIGQRLSTWFSKTKKTYTNEALVEKEQLYGIDWAKVKSWYESLGLKISTWTEKRKMAYISIFDFYKGDMDKIRDALRVFTDEVRNSAWIKGQRGSPKRDFEWLFNIDNFAKVIDGKYRNEIEYENNSDKYSDRRGTFVTETQNESEHIADF